MKWGRKWGKLHAGKDANNETLWGAEGVERPSGRVQVRLLRGTIVPCYNCRLVSKCAMYVSFTRHRLRHGEYLQGTNILHMCDIYKPNNAPHDYRSHTKHNRTRGKEPQ